MNLIEIKQYLMRVKIASLASLCTYFSCDSDVLRGMLSQWVRKGCVKKFSQTAACGNSCQKCIPAMTELYEWV